MTFHSKASLGARHPPHNWEYADATARLAATGFTALDVGKEAWQLDNDTYWRLTDDSPITWAQSGGVAGMGQTDTVTGSNGITNVGNNVNANLTPTYGSTANTICQGNDSRLSDARTPTSHASTHKSGGADSIKIDEFAAPTDVVTLNTSTSAHGLAPKLSGVATQYLNGNGTWSVPSGSSVFGGDFQTEASEGNSTTTSTGWQDKVTLTTGALTGTYRVGFQAELSVSASNRLHDCRLYNSTDAVELCIDQMRPSLGGYFKGASGFAYVTFSGSAKSFILQYASPNSTTVTIRRARIELWRVS